jgi:glucokinase
LEPAARRASTCPALERGDTQLAPVDAADVPIACFRHGALRAVVPVHPMSKPVAGAPWLVADIGGTNVRFGLVPGVGQGPQHIERMRCADFAGPAEAASHYLAQVAARRGVGAPSPRLAAFAVATVASGDRVGLTNSPWTFSCRQVRNDLGLDELLILNDFEALALSLPRLQSTQLSVHGTLATGTEARAVVGPGTGLGVAGLVHTGDGWTALPGEGGHVTMAAWDDFEAAVIAHVRREFEHVSAERLLSGIGLPLLHRAVAAVTGASAAPLPAEDIVQHGVAGSDTVCARTIDTFCAMLGTFAGNIALTLGARGGLYIGGGIVPRFADLFGRSRFRERFESKGRFRPYLASIPTALIVEPHATLTGASAAIERRAARDPLPQAAA